MARKLQNVLRFPTLSARKEFVDKTEETTKKIMRIVATCDLPTEEKEELVDFFLLLLNIVDLERARIDFELSGNKERGSRTRTKK